MALADRRWIRWCFLIGLALSIAMVVRSQVAGDQLNFLALGWRLVFENDWPVHGNPTSAGTFTPGGLSALVAGLPLLAWADFRAVAVLTLLSHLLAYWVLDRAVRSALSVEERVLLALLYWLNPWRLYHSGFVWNPSFLFLAGALHLWTAYHLRERQRFWVSFAHVLLIGLTAQVAIHVLLLVTVSLFLWWRGYIRLHLGGALAAAAVVAATLAPWAAAALVDPSLRPTGGEGRFFYFLNTSLRAATYWVRYASFALSRELFCFDFGELFGPGTNRGLKGIFTVLRPVLYYGSIAIALWANVWLWRGSGRWWQPAPQEPKSDRQWLIGVIRWAFIAVVATFALSPATVSRWYVFSVFHLSILTLVLAAGTQTRGRWRRWVIHGTWSYALVSVLLGVAFLLGGPMYRCGGERCSRAANQIPLRYDHPMLEPLGIQEACPVTVDDPEGWWIQTVREP